MTEVHLQIELKTDAIFTAGGGSAGGDVRASIPGATLLGAAAAASTPSGPRPLNSDDFFRAFVAGGVQFSDGLPQVDDAPTVPMPLCLYRAKGGGTLGLHNLVVTTAPPLQRTQQRDGFLTADGTGRLDIEVHNSIRTALAPDGRALDRHLHTLRAVPAGTTYLAKVRGADAALVQRVVDALCVAPRLGRSRGAEFGEVWVHRITGPAPSIPLSDAVSSEFAVLLLADAALRDPATGAPTLIASPENLGLPAGYRVQFDRSHVRTRRYSPFNAHRGRPDLERQVLAAGSVLVVAAPTPTTPVALRGALADGIGEHRASGLGAVVVAPKLLSAAILTPEDRRRRPQGLVDVPLPDDALGRLLKRRRDAARDDEVVTTWIGRVLGGLGGPGKSQWGEIRSRARAARRAGTGTTTLRADLAAHLSDGVTSQRWRGAAASLLAAIDRLAELPVSADRVRLEAVERLAIEAARAKESP